MYSLDFRKLAVSVFKRFKNYRYACSFLSISLSTLHRWVTKGIQAKKRTCFKSRKLTDKVKCVVNDALSKNAFLTLTKIQHIIVSSIGVYVSSKTIGLLLKRSGFTKKKAYLKIRLNDASKERQLVFSKAFTDIPSDDIVSLDECYFSENVLPLRGYALKGERVVVQRHTMTRVGRSLLMAVSGSGKINYLVVKGSINKSIFRQFLKGVDFHQGSTIVLDNVAFHKNKMTFLLKKVCTNCIVLLIALTTIL